MSTEAPDLEQTEAATLAGGSGGGSTPDLLERHQPLAEGAQVGRYVIHSKVGAGAMGVVYRAVDPDLERTIAIKLIGAPAGSGSSGRDPVPVIVEAQALARLNHPNVVTVTDVGELDGRVFVAMEFVEGLTLRQWLKKPRALAEILPVFVGAARGLQAAHEAGVTHGDFKPDNVMISDDGRVLVMDFGLATGEHLSELESSGHSLGSLRSPTRTSRGTSGSRGTLASWVGTPAYMAPEHFAREPLGPATDQFAFCVALWEAVVGRRPFGGASHMELATNVLDGAFAPMPTSATLPGWLRRVLERGLARAPEERWPSMKALSAKLERRRGSSRWVPAGGVVAGLAVLGLAGWSLDDARRERQRVTDCETRTGSIADVWHEGVRDQVRAGLSTVETALARETSDRVVPKLDAHAAAWTEAGNRVCRAQPDEVFTWTAELQERAQWCLQLQRSEMSGIVRYLSEGNPEAVRHAVTLAYRLDSPALCADPRHLARWPAPPSKNRGELLSLRAELAQGDALRMAGEFDAALVIAQRVTTQAAALGWAPLEARARLDRGRSLAKAGESSQAADELELAYLRATEAEARDVALDAAIELEFVLGNTLSRPDAARRWTRVAESLLSEVPGGADLEQARHLNAVGAIAKAQGRLTEALVTQEKVVALMETSLGAEHPELAQVLNNLANTLHGLERDDEARVLHDRALGIRRKVYGEQHPKVAESLNNLGNVLRAKGDQEAARGALEQALAIDEEYYGPDHPEVGRDLYNLAIIDGMEGDLESASNRLRRCLAIFERVRGKEHPRTAWIVTKLAHVALDQHRFDDAVELGQRALVTWQAIGAPPDSRANVRFILARALWGEGTDRRKAVDMAEAARRDYASSEHPAKDSVAELDTWLAAHPNPSDG